MAPYSTLAEWIAGTWMSPGIEIKGGVDGPKRADGRVE